MRLRRVGGGACTGTSPPSDAPAAKERAGLLGGRIFERGAAQVDEQCDRHSRDQRERGRAPLGEPERPYPEPQEEREAEAPQERDRALGPVLAEESDPNRKTEQSEQHPSDRGEWGERRRTDSPSCARVARGFRYRDGHPNLVARA